MTMFTNTARRVTFCTVALVAMLVSTGGAAAATPTPTPTPAPAPAPVKPVAPAPAKPALPVKKPALKKHVAKRHALKKHAKKRHTVRKHAVKRLAIKKAPRKGAGALEAFRNAGPVAISSTTVPTVIATLKVPAGSWVFIAKTQLSDATTAATTATCALVAGADGDVAQAALGAVKTATLPLMVSHTFTSAGSVSMACIQSAPAGLSAANTKIIAVPVSAASRSAVLG